jgi:hypothetical protein
MVLHLKDNIIQASSTLAARSQTQILRGEAPQAPKEALTLTARNALVCLVNNAVRACRFRKPYPAEWRRLKNRNIVGAMRIYAQKKFCLRKPLLILVLVPNTDHSMIPSARI